ncbi:MAG: hypothetical protein HN948_07760 [Clostridia bacterium]|jgi:Zn finger protein HypA/HybF involved in hydrogenase expression|nr:hypothetical protein [Clostridia bacterium]MBT7122891.1 hypothetical protein [Clostridia bacterium]
MHESALVYKILETIAPSMKPEHELKAVTLEVGEFSCVNTTTLKQLYKLATKNTFAGKSKLKFSVVKDNDDVIINSIEVSQ